MACESGDHVVGSIAGKPVRGSEWGTAIDLFARKVDDFNVRGQRIQIPHPGFVVECKFCYECGRAIDRAGLCSFAEALTAVEVEHV